MKIGARIIKTALADIICIFLGSFHKNSAFYHTAAIIICKVPAIPLLRGRGEYGTFVGALLGYIFA